MSVRERLHDRLDMFGLMGPVAPEVIAALPEALVAQACSPGGAPLRRRPTAGQTWQRLPMSQTPAAARASVVIHPPGMSFAELSLAAREHGYQGLPIAFHLSGPLLSVMLPHDLFDGVGTWEQLERIYQRACSVPVRPEARMQAHPVPTALRASGLLRPRALQAVRQVRRAAEASSETAPTTDHDVMPDDARRLAGLRTVWIAPEQAHAIAAAPDPVGDAPASRTMRLVALALEAAREAFPAETDVRVRVPVDLRRYLARGRAVDGPFSSSYPLGTLRTRGRSAASVGADLAEALASKGPLAAFTADVVGYVETRARHPRRGIPVGGPGRRTFNLVVSVLPARLPDSFWAEDEGDPVSAVMLLHRVQSTDPYIQVASVRGGICFALWDEAGVTDPDAFARAVVDLAGAYPLVVE